MQQTPDDYNETPVRLASFGLSCPVYPVEPKPSLLDPAGSFPFPMIVIMNFFL